MGEAARGCGDYSAARTNYEQALDIFLGIGDRRYASIVHADLGVIASGGLRPGAPAGHARVRSHPAAGQHNHNAGAQDRDRVRLGAPLGGWILPFSCSTPWLARL